MKPSFFSLAIFTFLQLQIIPLNAQTWSIAKRYSAPAGAYIGNSSVALAPDGSTYVVGNFRGTIDFDTVSISRPASATNDYGFLLKLDASLQPLWAHAFPERMYDVTVDAQGNAFVSGSKLASSDDSLAYVAKYAPNGNMLAEFSASGSADSWAKVVRTDLAGNCYIAGERFSAGVLTFGSQTMAGVSSRQCFLVKLSPNLSQVLWATYTGTSSNLDNLSAIEVDNNGFVYTSGNYSQNYSIGCFCYNGSFFTEKHNAETGVSVWKKIFLNGSGSSTQQLLSLDASGQSVFVSASFKTTVTFQTGITLTAAGNDDYHIFLAKMDAADGNVQWAKKVALSGDSNPTRMARQGAELFLNGYFFSPALMGDTLLTQQGVDAFLVETNSNDGAVLSAEGFSGLGAEYGFGLDVQDSVMVISGNSSSSSFKIGNLNLPGTANSIYVAKKGGALQSPPVAAFSADLTSGCTPFVVSFSDQSSNNPTTWNWQFPGGIPSSSTTQHPAVTYTTPGTYGVTLSTSNVAGTNSATLGNYVTVNPLPNAAFTVTMNGLAATFNNTSSIASYFWDFGDGQTSTEQNPVHTFTDCGTYTLVLTATNMCGTASSSSSVTVGNGNPTSSFMGSQNGFNVTFSNASVNADAYFWDFGDGQISSEQAPSHTYANCGTYTVTLTSTNICGTASSSSMLILGGGVPSTTFTFTMNGLAATFNNTSSNAIYLWDFGDGQTSTEVNPVHTYVDCGTYTVILTATNMCGTVSSTSSVTVGNGNPTSSFMGSLNGFTVIFSNGSVNADAYFWDFGDGQISPEQTPTHTYANCGTYIVTLTSTNICGTASSSSTLILGGGVPSATFTFTMNGLAATFNNTSSNTSYLWDFGDGQTSMEQNPVHIYADCGNYTVVLTCTNMCGTASSTASIITSVTPTSMFTSTVEGLQVSFTNTSTGGTSFFWNFGDGITSTLQNPPPHVYAGPDMYIVTLVVTNDCGATIFQQTVTVLITDTNTPEWLTDFRLFPNPNRGVFSVEMKAAGEDDIEFSILNPLGQMIHQETIAPQTESTTQGFDLGNVPPGNYWLRIRQGEVSKLQKIVVAR